MRRTECDHPHVHVSTDSSGYCQCGSVKSPTPAQPSGPTDEEVQDAIVDALRETQGPEAMTKQGTPSLIEPDHPCRETCSGWRQGFEKAAANAQREIDRLKREDESMLARLHRQSQIMADMEERAEKAEAERDEARKGWPSVLSKYRDRYDSALSLAGRYRDLLSEVIGAPKSPTCDLALRTQIREALSTPAPALDSFKARVRREALGEAIEELENVDAKILDSDPVAVGAVRWCIQTLRALAEREGS